jgi:hypothetical protein
VVSDVQLFSIPGLSCLFHYLLSLLRKGRQGQDLQPTIVIVRRTAEMKVPLASFMASRIVCISATLYGAVETLEVKESISRQLIKSWKKTDGLPILLLSRIPSSSFDASTGNLRSL